MQLAPTLPRLITVFCLVALLFGSNVSAIQPDDGEPPMRIEIDARDLPRKLVTAKLTIPLQVSSEPRQIALWYPKWVPGSHGPGGPIANVAGLSITDPNQQTLAWKRTPGEVYRITVDVPAEIAEIHIRVRYIANQPTTNSMGHDCFGSGMIGVISPGTLLFYQEGAKIDSARIAASLLLPAKWKVASALKLVADSKSEAIEFEPSTLRTFVDSPIMCGLYYRVYSLNDPAITEPIAPHDLHIFSDDESNINLDTNVLNAFTEMVTQTGRLIGSQPFDRFDILLALTNQLPANGLEHSRSTFNVLPENALSSLGGLKGWNRCLIPHEYLHSWCGKYRRPAGMVTDDFHSPKDTELLWVYEGLTQYMGELIEARSGLMSVNEFRDRVGVELRNATHQHNRQWRPLADTASASHVLRDESRSWSRLRGSQDYYMEGMLLWLEVDAILRQRTDGQKTIDDFCQVFFRADETKATAELSRPKPFDRNEVVEVLSSLHQYDWDGLISRRVETTQANHDPAVASLLGYNLEIRSEPPRISGSTLRLPSGIDEYDSVGAIFSSGGNVQEIRPGGAADQAKLSPGMQIMGINGRTWNASRLRTAIDNSENSAAIELLVSDGDMMKSVQLQYHEGSKYLTLVRDETKPDLLEVILSPK